MLRERYSYIESRRELHWCTTCKGPIYWTIKYYRTPDGFPNGRIFGECICPRCYKNLSGYYDAIPSYVNNCPTNFKILEPRNNKNENDIFQSQNENNISQLKIKEEMLLYLTLDGKIKPIPVFKDEMGNVIKEESVEIYFINKKKQKYEEKAEELEYLLSQEHIKEKELQSFFECNPEFILDGEYCNAIPQVILKDETDKKYIPDFILKPTENISVPAKIVELKLPNVEVIHNYTRAEAFTQKISVAVGQLRKYYRFFNSDENRKKFLEKYHFQVFCPRLALIVGKDIVDIDKDTLNDLKTTFNGIDITTYNEVLAKYRQNIKHFFN